MSSVDNRIVKMTFDNAKFENGVRTTIQSLTNLKKGLQLDGASKSLSKLEKAADGVTFSGLAKSVDTISNRFSNLGIVGITALQNITNKAMQTGEQMLKSLTIDPISTGFSEYETKINAIQTIMSNTASKGTTMSDITAVLNELNTYADKTIYNFAEMTKNIGTFTAAGIGLEDAASSIQGIANLAAASGSTSQQASTAMYQLSQALAAGTVKLMDWNSVVNAGMGGEKFQEALKATAREYGVSVDAIIEKNGSFRESLQEGWISADILNDTLKKFTVEGATEYAEAMMLSGKYTKEQADALIVEAQAMEDAATKVKTWTQLWDTMKESAQSGWAQSWELVVGNFLEARDFFTQISDIIGGVIENSANARNSMLDEALTSNWTKLTREINACGIETDIFEQKVKDLATASGYDISAIIKEYDSLENAIRKGALPLDLLNQALDAFSGTIENVKIDKTTADFEKLTSTLRRGDASASVRELQQALKDFGYDLGKYGVDGKFGAETEAAVRAFQEANGLIANGIADADTIAALKKVGTTFSEVTVDVNRLNGECRDLVETVTQKSGRELALDSIVNALKGIIKIGDTAKEAFDAIFDPSDDAEQLVNALTKVHSFSERMLQSITDNSDELGRALKGAFAILDILGFTGKTIATGGLKILCSVLGIAGDNALELAANAGDAIVAFHEWFEANNVLAKSFDYLAEGIPVLINLAQEWFEEWKQTPEVQKFLSDLSSDVENTVKYFEGGKQVILDFISRTKELDKIDLAALDKIFEDFCDNVVSYFMDIDGVVADAKKIFERLKTVVSSMTSGITEKLGTVKDKIGSFFDFIKDKFSGFGLAEAAVVAFSATMIGAALLIVKALNIIKSPFGMLMDIGDSIAGAFDALKFNFQVKAFATMIITLVGALALMTMLDQEKLVSSAKVLGIFAAGMVAAMTALSVLEKFKLLDSFQSNAMSIVALSASLAIMVAALKGMEYVDATKIGSSIITLGAMMAMLMTFSALLAKATPKLSSGSVTLLAYAASMVILAEAMVKISAIPTDKIVDTIVSLVVIMGAFSLLAMTSRGASFGSALTMIAAVVTLNALIDTFDRIKMVDVDAIMANIESFALVFGAFASLMILSGLFGKRTASAGVGLLAMSAALLILVESFDELAALEAGDVNKAMSIITDMVTLFAMVSFASKLAGENGGSAGLAMLGFAASIALLSGAVKALSGIDATGLKNATLVIISIGAMMAIVVASTAIAQKANGTIIVITGCILALSMAVGLLSMVNPEGLNGALRAIGILGAVLGGIVGLTAFATKSAITILAIGVVVGILAGCLYALSNLDATSNLQNALGLSAVLLAVSAAMAILQAVPVAAAGKVALGLLAAFGTITAIVLAIGGIAELCGDYDLFGKGADALGKIGTAIGSFVGNLIGSLGAGVTSGLPQMGSDIRAFTDEISAIDPNAGAGAESLAKAITAIADATTASAWASIGPGNSLSRFADMAPEFGEILTSFSDAISKLSPEDIDSITTASTAVDSLAALASKISGTTNLFSFFNAQGDLGTFAEDLTSFGAAMSGYATSVAGLDVGAIETSVGAAELLVNLAGIIPDISTSWDSIAGGKGDMGTFASDLSSFGKAMKSYAESVAGLDVAAIETSIEGANMLVELANTAPGISTWVDAIATGSGDLGTFASDLSAFGRALSSYSASVAGLDTEAIQNSIGAAEALVVLANTMPGISTLWDHIAGGGGDLGTFGSDLAVFGSYLSSYAASVSGIDIESLSATMGTVQRLINMATGISGIDFSGFGAFGESLGQVATTGIEGFTTAFAEAEPQIQTAASNAIASFVTGMESKIGDVDNAARGIADSAASEISSRNSEWVDVGYNAAAGFAQGIRNGTYIVVSAADAMAAAALQAAKSRLDQNSPSKEFEHVGMYNDEGMAIGMLKHIRVVTSASETVAGAAIDSMNASLSRLSSVLSAELSSNPTIRPVMDLSDVDAGVSRMDRLFAGTRGLTLGTTLSNVRSVTIGSNGYSATPESTPVETTRSVVNNFTQNNYSPKALSRVEIYRQTNNLFATTKEVLKNA